MRRRARSAGGRQAEVTIETLGGRGDGIAKLDGRPVFVPLTLPGERVRVRLVGESSGGLKAEVIELLDAAAERREAPCRHFGPCGGCAVQHLEAGGYAAWKRDQVVQALARRSLPEDMVRPLLRVPPGTRRRAVLAALRLGDRATLGFHERGSNRIVDLAECLLLTPPLLALLPVLRAALPRILPDRQPADLTLTETESGVDLLLASRGEPDLSARQALSALAEEADLARVSWSMPGGEAEPVALRRRPRVNFGGVTVEPPPGAFLQPSAAGEAALRELILGSLPEVAGRIVELYAGCGSFSFALAGRGRLHAVEGDAAALDALDSAARQSGPVGRITCEERDLARSPLTAAELSRYDCVVFDPPRAGAREQAARIAESTLPAAVAVSCNPNTFARDARILVDGGFALAEVTPLDQFPWSGHVELVARFER